MQSLQYDTATFWTNVSYSTEFRGPLPMRPMRDSSIVAEKCKIMNILETRDMDG